MTWSGVASAQEDAPAKAGAQAGTAAADAAAKRGAQPDAAAGATAKRDAQPVAKVEPSLAAAPGQAPAAAPITLSLNDATSRALAESVRVRKAKDDLRTAEHAVGIANSAFLPTVGIEAQVGTLHDRQPILGEAALPELPRDRNLYDAELVLRQPIFSGFRDMNTYRAKKAARETQEWQLKSVGLDVSLAVIEQYFGIQRAQAELESERQVSTLRVQQLDETKSRARQGRSTDLDVLEAEYAVKAQEPTIKTLQRDIERRSLQLARLMALPLDQTFKLTDQLNDVGVVLQSAQIPTVAAAYESALKENPALKHAESARRQLELSQASESAKHLPAIDLEARAGSVANLKTEFATRDSIQYSGVLKVSVPIFSGLSSFDERSANASSLSAAADDQALAREQLLQDVIDAFRDLELASDQIAVQTKNLELTQRAIKNANSLFRDGRATATSVLDSYSRELAARRGYVEAQYSRIMALAKIRALVSP